MARISTGVFRRYWPSWYLLPRPQWIPTAPGSTPVSQALGVPAESLAIVVSSRGVSSEALARVAKSSGSPAEGLTRVTASSSKAAEGLALAARGVMASAEALAIIADSVTTPTESLARVLSSRALPVEWLERITFDWEVPSEALARVASSKTSAAEALARLASQRLLGAESLAIIARTFQLHTEALGGEGAVFNSLGVRSESLATVANTVTAGSESSAPVTSIRTLSAESLLGLSTSRALPAEGLLLVPKVVTLSGEALQAALQTGEPETALALLLGLDPAVSLDATIVTPGVALGLLTALDGLVVPGPITVAPPAALALLTALEAELWEPENQSGIAALALAAPIALSPVGTGFPRIMLAGPQIAAPSDLDSLVYRRFSDEIGNPVRSEYDIRNWTRHTGASSEAHVYWFKREFRDNPPVAMPAIVVSALGPTPTALGKTWWSDTIKVVLGDGRVVYRDAPMWYDFTYQVTIYAKTGIQFEELSYDVEWNSFARGKGARWIDIDPPNEKRRRVDLASINSSILRDKDVYRRDFTFVVRGLALFPPDLLAELGEFTVLELNANLRWNSGGYELLLIPEGV